MKRIVVIGCYGYIGNTLVRKLLKKGYEVIGFDIYNKHFFDNELHFSFRFLDYLNLEAIENVDILYYLAWDGVSSNDKNNFSKQFSNIEKTFIILEYSRINKINKIIIPGSMSEFSNCREKVNGTEMGIPSDNYSFIKSIIRQIAMCYAQQYDMNLNYLLITSVYGEDRKDANLIYSTINKLMNNITIETTKLEQLWDYIYIDDLIEAMILIGEKGKKNEIYPIGSGEVKSLKEYVLLIANILKKQNLLSIGCLEYKKSFIDNSVPNIEKIKELGFCKKNTFEENIIKIINSIKCEEKKNG